MNAANSIHLHMGCGETLSIAACDPQKTQEETTRRETPPPHPGAARPLALHADAVGLAYCRDWDDAPTRKSTP